MNVGFENQPTFDDFLSGVTAVGTTAVQLAANRAAKIVLRAAGGNTGTVTLGRTSGVTSLGGFTLSAGQQVTLELDDLSRLFAIASAASQNLEWLILR